MKQISLVHPSMPYLLTVFVSIFFMIFGLYGLSADNKFRKLPYLKPAIFIIATLYILRGAAQLFTDLIIGSEGIFLGTLYSVTSLSIGLLFLIGGLQKWKMSPITH